MKGIYKGKMVKITKLVLSKNIFVSHPILVQVRIEWKEDGQTWTDYAQANEIEFVD